MKTKSIFICIIITLCAVHASGYNTDSSGGDKVKWDTNTVRMRAGGISFPPGNAYTAALGDVISTWNDHPGKFNFTITYNDSTVGFSNDQNEIWFSSDPDDLDGHPAVTWTWTSWIDGSEIVETDVLFDVSEPWTPGTVKSSLSEYGGTSRSFRTTALHELGHVIGLEHTANLYNIMGEDFDHLNANGNTIFAYPGEDASNGAVYLYGEDTGAGEDLGVVHWRWTGSRNGYSTHGRTRIFDMNDNVCNSVSINNEPLYFVKSGSDIYVEFTYENNGLHSQTVDIQFYLSNDNLIDRTDTRIGKYTITVNRDTPDLLNHKVTLPSNLTINSVYYIGVIIDDPQAVAEFTEANNATYTGIKITDPELVSLVFNPLYATGISQGTVSLDGDAPPGGITVSLSSSRSTVSVPANVTISAGQKSVTFTAGFVSGLHYYNDAVDGYIRTDVTAVYNSNTVTSPFYLEIITESDEGQDTSGVSLCDSNCCGGRFNLERLCLFLELVKQYRQYVCPYPDCPLAVYKKGNGSGKDTGLPESICRGIYDLVISEAKGKSDPAQLKKIGSLFEKLPAGRYFTAARKTAFLKELRSIVKINPETFDILLKAFNAVQLDYSVPSFTSQTVKTGSGINISFNDAARVYLSSVTKKGNISLIVSESDPVLLDGFQSGWPQAIYEFKFSGTVPANGYIDIGFYVGGTGFPGAIKDLRLFEWDGKKYIDITTNVDEKGKTITGRTKRFAKYIIVVPKTPSR